MSTPGQEEVTGAGPALVLVVDDGAINRDILVRKLRRMGLETVEADNGRRALEVMEQQPCDLVLLDLMMPEMDGYQVLEAVRQSPRLREVPIVVISALDDMASIVRAIELGAADYLPKPADPVLLRARVKTCLEKKRFRDRERAFLAALQEEQARSERLLRNVLPGPVADRLKGGPVKIADSFAEATVLFADIVGFSGLASALPAQELVGVLNEVFSSFDALCEQLGLEKIKTIGDCYMVVGGVPSARADHVEAVAELALGMMAALPAVGAAGLPALRLRVGVHTGPVVAGVIGTKKFIYDLWGETVNMASRMESHGVPGAIQVSQPVYERLRDAYAFVGRGLIEVKGHGDVHAYLLTGRLPR